jgi:hypothetical protein
MKSVSRAGVKVGGGQGVTRSHGISAAHEASSRDRCPTKVQPTAFSPLSVDINLDDEVDLLVEPHSPSPLLLSPSRHRIYLHAPPCCPPHGPPSSIVTRHLPPHTTTTDDTRHPPTASLCTRRRRPPLRAPNICAQPVAKSHSTPSPRRLGPSLAPPARSTRLRPTNPTKRKRAVAVRLARLRLPPGAWPRALTRPPASLSRPPATPFRLDLFFGP